MSERNSRARVVLAGWHGRDVEEDHDVLHRITTRLHSLRPDVEVIAVGPDPIAITSRHGIPGAPIADPVAVDAVLLGAAGLIVGGGAPWRDAELVAVGGVAGLLAFDMPGTFPRPWTTAFPAVAELALLAILRAVPLHLHAIRIEELTDGGGAPVARLLAHQAASLTAGDPPTQDWLARHASTPEAAIIEDTGDIDALSARLPETGDPPGLPAGRLRLRRAR